MTTHAAKLQRLGVIELCSWSKRLLGEFPANGPNIQKDSLQDETSLKSKKKNRKFRARWWLCSQKGKEKGHFAHGFVMQTSSVTLTFLFRKSVNSHTLGIRTERPGYHIWRNWRMWPCCAQFYVWQLHGTRDWVKFLHSSDTDQHRCLQYSWRPAEEDFWIPAPPPLALERSGDAKPSPWPWGTGSTERRKHPLKRR